jgi:transcriptional regulator with AAA-type ATPase domain
VSAAVESRFEALRTATTPLVGREEQVELLLRRWRQAKAADGRVVLILGEPGIGKSRIAQAVCRRRCRVGSLGVSASKPARS